MSKKYPSFYEKLQQATNEDKQVNEIYKHALAKEFSKYRNDDVNEEALQIDIDNPIYIKTDGIFKCTCIKSKDSVESIFYMLMECKLDEDFNNPKERAKVLTQVVAYLVQIKLMLMNNDTGIEARATFGKVSDDLQMPQVIFVGSKISCFVIDTKSLQKYYGRYFKIDEIKSASTFYKTETGKIVLEQLEKDADINVNCQIFKTSDKFCLFDVVDLIYKYGSGTSLKNDFQPRTLYRAFTRFTTRVLTADTTENLSERQLAQIFAQFIVNKAAIKQVKDLDENVQELVINGIDLKVNSMEWNAFAFWYNLRKYSDDEQKAITAITDQLIEDDDRRRRGDFYTPAIWVNESQKLLDKNLEQGWRSKYMVWDCAWGTGNLTRDCTRENGTYIKDLYCQTLADQELNTGARYNPSATKFQYDFLNDDVSDFEDAKEHLRDALRAFTNKADIIERNANFRAVIDLIQKSLESDNENLVKKARQAVASLRAALNIIEDTKLYAYAPDLVDGLLGRRTETEQSAEELGTLRQNLGIKGEPKKLLFYINPPYGTAGDAKKTNSKSGIAKTEINIIMLNNKIGKCSQQLYAQFLYRIDCIKHLFNVDTSVGLFQPTLIMCGESFSILRDKILSCATYKDGFVFKASQFADVKDNWAIQFTIYKYGMHDSRRCFKYTLLDNDDTGIHSIGTKSLYSLENSALQKQISKTKLTDEIETFTMQQALKQSNGTCKISKNALCYAMIDRNAVESNATAVYLLPHKQKAHIASYPVTEDNAAEMLSIFQARKLIDSTWINSKDEYMVPNTEHPKYSQWQNDCIVYSIFNNQSQQSQLRNIEYNGKVWNIQNEFFWMQASDIAKLSKGKYNAEDSNGAVYTDLDEFGEDRFVYKKLQDITLSPDAQAVLDKATEIVKKSFKYRDGFNKEHPEYNINTWDAGWYQIKGLCKSTPEMQQDMKEFDELYKKFGDRLRPLVYELGFLYK